MGIAQYYEKPQLMSLTIHLYIRPEKAKANGEAPIYLRLTAGGRKTLSIKRSIAPHKWDSVGYRSKGKKPEDARLNAHIQSIIGALRRIETNHITQGKEVTASAVLALYTGKSLTGDSLVTYYNDHVRKMEQTYGLAEGVSPRTVGRYRTVAKHFVDFLKATAGISDILLTDLTYEHLLNFDFYLKTVRKIENNTRVKYIFILRGIIKTAVETGKLNRDPFLQWKGRVITKERTRLTEAEVHRLYTTPLHSKRLSEVRDIFVFSCYTGLAYIVAYNLTTDNLITTNGHFSISTNRQKTNTKCSIPLLPIALDILKKYEPAQCRRIEGRLLPVKSNQKMNSYLKEIAGICGIEKNLTFHIARHTFATTITLANDVRIETVSEMLGHKHIATTQHYAKMIQTKVDRDMAQLAKRLAHTAD